jgi:nucleoporin NUP2
VEWEKKYGEEQRAERAKVAPGFGQGGFKPEVAQVDGPTEKPSTTPPSFNITAATPSKDKESPNKFSNLFGQKSDTASSAPPATSSVGFSFGSASASASALQPAASYLFASANTSGLSSRATSPGATDNESVGTDGEADTTNDPQISLIDRPGEENEEVLFKCNTKALKFMNTAAAAKQKGSKPNAYNTVGKGELRVLKNTETGKSRIVIRAGLNVLLNTHLAPFISYTSDPERFNSKGERESGVVRLGVAVENDKIEQWVFKVFDAERAAELASILTKNKGSTSS